MPQAQGRAFALVQPDVGVSDAVVEGMIIMFSSCARILFDIGSSHSFISASFILSLGLHVEAMDFVLSVVSPLGGEVDTCSICRGCVVRITGQDLVADFVVLDMAGYDVVLDMDWLSTYHATVDCYKKMVTIHPQTDLLFCFLVASDLLVIPYGEVRSWA